MISLSMIVKNEALTLERTIAAVRDFVDEIVIGIDATSNDGTEEIAHRCADIIVPIALSDELEIKGSLDDNPDWGFSKARNLVLNKCNPAHWRLILDGHETVKNAEHMYPALAYARGAGSDCIEFLMHFEPAADGIPQTVFGSRRLLAPHIRYENPIHNVPAVKHTFQAHNIIVEHRKSDQAPADKIARDVQRSSANIDGLRKKLRLDGDDARSWYYLATAYRESSRHREAIGAFEECLNFSRWNEERWSSRVNLGTCYLNIGEVDKARDQFSLALDEMPAMAETYYFLADIAYKKKRYREAETWLEKCYQLSMPNCIMFVNPRIYMVERYDLLSMVYNHLGEYGRAIEMAEKALEAAPNERIEKNVKIWSDCIAKFDRDYYDRIWSASTAQRQATSEIELRRFSTMARELDGADRILDFGSGPGRIIESLPESSEYVGIDISPVARKAVIAAGGRAVESLSALNGSMFNGCILGEILEHLEKPEPLLRELKNYLEPGSVIVASVPRYGAIQDRAHTFEYTDSEFLELVSCLGDAELLEPVGPWNLCRIRTNEL